MIEDGWVGSAHMSQVTIVGSIPGMLPDSVCNTLQGGWVNVPTDCRNTPGGREPFTILSQYQVDGLNMCPIAIIISMNIYQLITILK